MRKLLLLLGCAFLSSALADKLPAVAIQSGQPREFVEYRMLPQLVVPQELQGYAEVGSDGVLLKTIQAPYAETVEIGPDYLKLTRGGRSRRLSLNKQPALADFYRGLTALLAGDEEVVNELFIVTRDDLADVWRVRCEPRDEQLRGVVQKIVMSGRQREVEEVLTMQSDDRWQRLVFAPGGSLDVEQR